MVGMGRIGSAQFGSDPICCLLCELWACQNQKKLFHAWSGTSPSIWHAVWTLLFFIFFSLKLLKMQKKEKKNETQDKSAGGTKSAQIRDKYGNFRPYTAQHITHMLRLDPARYCPGRIRKQQSDPCPRLFWTINTFSALSFCTIFFLPFL